MRTLAKISVLVALLCPALASAQLSLGARLGYAFPMGEAFDGGDLDDAFSGAIPLQIDAGWRLTPEFTLGAYFAAAYGLVGGDFEDVCDELDLDCSGRVYRFGVQVDYAFKDPARTVTPWIGAGIGYEWLSVKGEQGSIEATEDYDGWEFLNLQGGLDWKAGQLQVGPFVMLSIGQLSNYDFEGPNFNESGDIPDDEQAVHEWLQIGIRGRFDL